MWTKWLPWRYMLSRLARSKGFLDPLEVLTQFNRFSKPSDLVAPMELLRAGAVLFARGMMNRQAIQHNLDWVWPYWVVRQFAPSSESFIPRAFTIAHMNLTQRNWTGVGLPDADEIPIIDPRGLVMPFFDSWSIDAWVIDENRNTLLPSHAPDAEQGWVETNNLVVRTATRLHGLFLESTCRVDCATGVPECVIALRARSNLAGRLIVSLRPYNPEGISFIHSIKPSGSEQAWHVNDKHVVILDQEPRTVYLADYRYGDVYHMLFAAAMPSVNSVTCDVGMASGAFVYDLVQDVEKSLTIRVPLHTEKKRLELSSDLLPDRRWREKTAAAADLALPQQRYTELYRAAIKAMVLHAGRETYAGPFTYRQFWFRDATFIAHALLCANMIDQAEAIIASFKEKQNSKGYFLSQDGEWDSNGQALWLLDRYTTLTGKTLEASWIDIVRKAAQWIADKRLPPHPTDWHGGLLPAGYSAEHFGPNDFYYWDDFWSVAGLHAAARLLRGFNEQATADRFEREAGSLLEAIELSLTKVDQRLGQTLLPASVYRRMDSAAVGSIIPSYPLRLWKPDHPRLVHTLDYLLTHCCTDKGFFHEICHCGINPYLTLHIAQALLRAGDTRFAALTDAIADLASPTGQWPEAMHPQLGTGCMGDGQHIWASAEWVMMMRNSFVREEEDNDTLVLCSGLHRAWVAPDQELHLGPTPTAFGLVSLRISAEQDTVQTTWEARWHHKEPRIELRFPWTDPITVPTGAGKMDIPLTSTE